MPVRTMNRQQSRPTRSNESPACHSFRQRWGMLALTCITTGVLSFTFFFACNISADQPVASDLIFDQPQRSVLALNILSQISMFLLYELTTSLLEAIRWTLACSRSGSSAFTFLILSRATNNLGILSLLMSKGSTPRKIQKDGHRFWGTQRLFFVFLRGALAVLLLADINFETTQHPVYQFPITRSGLSPLNTSLINTDQFNITATAQFWWYFPAILSDSLAVQPVTPLNCTGDQCKSFFFPGSMRNILLDPKLPPIGSNEYPGAKSYMQNDAPGYQIDYAPLDPSDPTFAPTDCQVFGIDMMAIQICLKNTQSSLLAGWSACPDATAESSGCINTTDWRSDIPLQTKMTVSERRATTIFDRFNFTILDIVDMSAPNPFLYTPEDLFPFYEIIFAIDETQPNWFATTQMLFLTSLTSFLRYDSDTETATGSIDQISRLQEFMAVPMAVFNDVIYGVGLPPNMGTTVTLAIPSYRLTLASYTLYSFMAGGFIALIWCYCTLCASWWIPTPEASLFPEIDFASKLPSHDNLSAIMNLEEKPKVYSSVVERVGSIADFSTLSNSRTLEIKKRLALARFFIRFSKNDSDDKSEDFMTGQEVVLRVEEDGSPASNNGTGTRVV